jgi:hypothetical protein
MAVTTTTYGASTAITMDLSALAASASFIAGRESNEIDNSSNKYVDALVRGTFTVGTTPAITGGLAVYVWGSDVAASATNLDVIDGVDSAESFTTTSLGATVKLASFTPVLVNTSDTTYQVALFSVAQLFGGAMPKYWGLYVAHNMTAALRTNASNTNSFTYTGVTYTTA